MEQDIFDIVKLKDFSELTTEERMQLEEFCENEQEFSQLKSSLLGIDRFVQTDNIQPDEKVKQSLDDLFMAQSYPKIAPLWYNKLIVFLYPKDKPAYKRPALQIAAAALLFLMLTPLITSNPLQLNKPQLAKNEVPTESKVEAVKEITNDKELSDLETLESAEQEGMTTVIDSKVAKVEVEPTSRRLVNSMDERDIVLSSKFEDLNVQATSSVMVDAMDEITHPDGIFVGNTIELEKSYSISMQEAPDLLDLITATF